MQQPNCSTMHRSYAPLKRNTKQAITVLIQSRHLSKSLLSESNKSEKINMVQRLMKLKSSTVKVSDEKSVIVTFRSFEAYKDALNLWPLKSYLEGVSDTACRLEWDLVKISTFTVLI
jgi:hypothetical protein